MILKIENGVKLSLDRNLNGVHVFTVSGPGVEKLRWYGYQNERYAREYFRDCVNRRK